MLNNGITASSRVAPVVTGGSLSSDNNYFYRTFTSNNSIIITQNAIEMEYFLVGGGGGPYGIVVSSNNVYQPGGGAGGNITLGTSKILPGTYPITIGAGGTGPVISGTAGQTGGSTIVQGIATATGGRGGEGTTGPVSIPSDGGDNLLFFGGKGANDGLIIGGKTVYAGGGGAGITSNGTTASVGTAGLGGNGTVVWGGTYSQGGRGAGQKSDGSWWNTSGGTIPPNTGNGAEAPTAEIRVSDGAIIVRSGSFGASGIVIIRYKKNAL